jgi:cell division protease FtsH
MGVSFMKKKTSLLITYGLIALAVFMFFQYSLSPTVINVSYTQFKKLVTEDTINSVVISTNFLKGFEIIPENKKEPLFPKQSYLTPRVDDKNIVDFLEKNEVDIIAQNENTFLMSLISWVLPPLFFVGIWFFLMRRMGQSTGTGIMTLGKNKAKLVAQKDIGITFKDVAGQDEAKQELQEVIEFLKDCSKFTRLGARIPKGILLVGPPGTGKTLLAKAVAGETGVSFFSISGSDFIEMFVGVGAARIRDLFNQAKKVAPCIVFIDELDALGKARGSGMMGGHNEQEQTLNQLLVEMDGFEPNKGVIILAAINRPEILDPALLRPGRFDRQILVDRPDLKDRLAILNVHSRNVVLGKNLDLKVIARRTPGFTGADLANLINEASLLAARKEKKAVSLTEIEEAIDRLIAGLEKKNRLLNEKEKKTVAYHETGHAIIAFFRLTAEKVHKISIVPRGISALGFTLQLPTEDRYLMSLTELLGKIDVLLGGRAAEKLVFGEITTSAQNDLQRATDIARSIVTLYGMNDKLGYPTYQRPPRPFIQENFFPQKEISDHTARLIDEEVKNIFDVRMAEVEKTLQEKEKLLHKVAEKLLEKETIDGKEFKKLIG